MGGTPGVFEGHAEVFTPFEDSERATQFLHNN